MEKKEKVNSVYWREENSNFSKLQIYDNEPTSSLQLHFTGCYIFETQNNTNISKLLGLLDGWNLGLEDVCWIRNWMNTQ